jgi:hypothetical protein
MVRFSSRLAQGTALALSLLATAPASAFCGFYVAQADTKLFNEASKVVLARGSIPGSANPAAAPATSICAACRRVSSRKPIIWSS